MTFKQAIVARLLGAAAVAEIIGVRAGWTRRLQQLPAISLLIVADPRPQHMDGAQRVRPTWIQLDAWAGSDELAATLREAAIASLTPPALVDGIQFQRGFVTGLRAGPEQERSGTALRAIPELFRESIDFKLTHDALS